MLARRLLTAIVCLGVAVASTAAARADMNDPLATRLTQSLVSQLFPDADGIATIAGDPPIAVLTRDGEIVGYMFSTHETMRPAGYSGLSFDIIIALDGDGVIRDLRLLEEHEPLISPDQISLSHLSRFLTQLHQFDVKDSRRVRTKYVDHISGATVSAMAMLRATKSAAIMVGYLKGIIADGGDGLSLDRYSFAVRTWPDLIADGSIRALPVSNRTVRRMFLTAGLDEPDIGPDDALFLTLYAALATPPSVGRNLFGAGAFRQISQAATPGEQNLIIGSTGDYLWLPRNPWLVEVFDRVRIVQNETLISLRPENFYPAHRFAIAGAPKLRQAGRFRIPAESGFDPLQDWAVEITVNGAESEDAVPAVTFTLPYRVPGHYVMGDDVALEDAGFKQPNHIGLGGWRESALTDWQRTWIDKQWSIVGLVGLLAATTMVMLFQHRIARARRVHALVRTGLLVVTLVWLGWVAGTQLTILTVTNYVSLAMSGVDWHAVLFDPLMVILSAYVLISLVLWGRGLFCGWLCPFGALQELVAKLGAVLRVPRVAVPPAVQKRAWAIKYGVAAVLLGLVIFMPGWATSAAEVEPFKTAISLRFERSWPYVLYAVLLLGAGLFVERFFCRYLCPLGAVLALAGRFHVFAWLKRRPECGSACHLCENSCPIGAIEATGAIDMNECLQCLDCQVEYYDDQRCPPLVAERKQRRVGVAISAA